MDPALSAALGGILGGAIATGMRYFFDFERWRLKREGEEAQKAIEGLIAVHNDLVDLYRMVVDDAEEDKGELTELRKERVWLRLIYYRYTGRWQEQWGENPFEKEE
jgi:hypothetical protein